MPMLGETTGQEPAVRRFVTGGSGVRLAVREVGPAGAQPTRPPFVLLHGWAQSGGVWHRQLTGPLVRSHRLLAADLRGHGDSDVPATGYDSGAEWAEDVRALLAEAGRPAVLVGWSYGGLVITDYLRRYGTAGLTGLVFVGAITEIGRGHPGGRVGPAMRAALPAALSDDPAVAEPALREFVTGMHAGRRPSRLAESLVAAALRVPGRVRAALFDRDVTSADVLAAVDVPTLVLHGRDDQVVAPAAAEYAAGLVPGATLTWFDHTGHLPFVERAADFAAAVAEHVDRCCPPTGETA